MTILLTGFSGNIGPEVARCLRSHRVLALVRDTARAPRIDGVTLVEGSLERLPAALKPHTETIVHCAASTAFTAAAAELRAVNVEGTARLLDFARGCPRLRKFVHVSTTCVCGDRTGKIAEEALPDRPHFLNAYEASKWEAEQIVLNSALPAEIVRVAVVAGSEREGSVRRPGALHHAFYWLYKGLIPMIPGTPDARVDLISTEFAADAIAAVTCAEAKPGRIVHASGGNHAPTILELLDFLAGIFSRTHRAWASGAVTRPDLVDGRTFTLFEESVRQSGDVLFQRVCSDAQSFLPALLYPRIMATSFAQSLALPNWRDLAGRVTAWLVRHVWENRLEGRGLRDQIAQRAPLQAPLFVPQNRTAAYALA